MKIKSLLITTLLTVFCVGNLFAQEQTKNVSNQCENFGKESFVGDSISLNLQNEDIKVFLNQLTDKFGCNFLIDRTIKVESLEIKIEDAPWNVVLDAILRSQGLSWRKENGTNSNGVSSKIIFIATKESLLRYLECSYKSPCDEKIPSSELWTEFIKFNYLRICDGCPPPNVFYVRLKPVSTSKVGILLVKLVEKLLSQKGSVEIDTIRNTLIITDIKEKVEMIRKQLEEWDRHETDLEKIIKDFESKNKEQKLK